MDTIKEKKKKRPPRFRASHRFGDKNNNHVRHFKIIKSSFGYVSIELIMRLKDKNSF